MVKISTKLKAGWPGERKKSRKTDAAYPTKVITVSFALIILVGAILLTMPFSSKSGEMTPFLDCLFTATSATCVTGLVIYDTYLHWSVFGQVVILCMIQLGGLGLLTFSSFFSIIVGKKLGLRGAQLAKESMNARDMKDVRHLAKVIFLVSFSFEAVGALLLSLTFVPKYGSYGIFMSVFHAVSAFCNAGFDLLGMEGPFSSLIHYNGAPLVLYVISSLIVFGGLGFAVWNDLYIHFFRPHKERPALRLRTKLILGVFGALLIAGILIFELGNVREEFIRAVGYRGNPAAPYFIYFGVMILLLLLFCGRDLKKHYFCSRNQRPKLALHSKTVLAVTAFLLIFGVVSFAVFEWNNPATMGALPLSERINAIIFQSVTPRTAGFNSVDFAAMRPVSQAITVLLMFIGAAPGSTGGGIKVTSFAVLVMTVISVMKGKEDCIMNKKRIAAGAVFKALAISMIAMLAVAVTSLTIIATQDGITGLEAVFEAVSAFGTVGLSVGVTSAAGVASKIVLILTMFMGRVGPVSLAVALSIRNSAESRHEILPEGRILIG